MPEEGMDPSVFNLIVSYKGVDYSIRTESHDPSLGELADAIAAATGAAPETLKLVWRGVALAPSTKPQETVQQQGKPGSFVLKALP